MREVASCAKCGRQFSIAEGDMARRFELSLLGCPACRLKEAGIEECPRECSGCEHFEACPVKIKFICPICGETRHTPFRKEAQKAQEVVVLREPEADERQAWERKVRLKEVGQDEDPPWVGPRGCRECRIKRHPAAADSATFKAVLDFFTRTGDDVGLWALVEGVAEQAVGEKPKGPGSLLGHNVIIASD